MSRFQIALTGDYLGTDGQVAYGDIGLARLADAGIEYRFLTDQSPSLGDSSYWQRYYSLELRPDHLRDIDGLIVLRPWVKRGAFAEAPRRLVAIGRSGAGYDKLDLDTCTDNDVVVFNAPRALDHSTASTALMFILALAKRLPEQERITRAGRWDLQAATMGSEIQGRTLGIIGLGNSGRELARLVAPFQMRLLAYSPHAHSAEAAALGVELTSLTYLLAEADFVSLHARLSSETRRMISAPQLALMKSSAYLINIARGELIDQAALIDGLRRRQLAGAALDVFESEPLPADDPLLALDNVIVTPHWSCSTREVWRATGNAMVDGMLRVAAGRIPSNVINPEVLERPGFRAKLARLATDRSHP